MAVRPGLKWTLGAAALLSVIAIVAVPNPSSKGGPGSRDPTATVAAWTDAPRPAKAMTSILAMVPTQIDRVPIEISEQDPFYQSPPPPPPAPAQPPPPPVTSPVVAAPVEAPQPPPMTHRFFGTMRNPDGQVLTYVTDGASTVQAVPGVTLSSGYVIDAITDREIHLLYPPLSSESRISIPPAPNP